MTDQEKMLIETAERSKSNSHRLDAVENEIKDIQDENKAIYKIATSIEVMANQMSNIEQKVDDVKDMANKTAKVQKDFEKVFNTKLSNIEVSIANKAEQAVENAGNLKIAKTWSSAKTAIVTAIASMLGGGLFLAAINFMK